MHREREREREREHKMLCHCGGDVDLAWSRVWGSDSHGYSVEVVIQAESARAVQL